jgi:hypothetical protein
MSTRDYWIDEIIDGEKRIVTLEEIVIKLKHAVRTLTEDKAVRVGSKEHQQIAEINSNIAAAEALIAETRAMIMVNKSRITRKQKDR